MATDTTTQQIVDVVTPSAGESVTEGTILEWHAQVGDEIKVDETIVEISTDKVDVELPSPATGTISEILVAEGDTVTVGQVIARITVGGAAPVEPDAPAAPSGNGAPNGGPAAEPQAATEAPAESDGDAGATAQEPETSTGGIVDVVTPAAGESVSEGTVLEWHVKVGDEIKLDATIVEISTDKVDIELPSPATGTVTELLVEEGDTVTVGQVIARIAAGAAGAPPAPAPADGAPAQAGSPSAPASTEVPAGTRVSPVAARAAAAEGVDLGAVQGSGPSGRITK